MGFIADNAVGDSPPTLPRSPTDAGRGRRLWREVFDAPGATHKEEQRRPGPPPVPGGSYGRSVLSAQDAATKRLLQAMRSNAPGGWTDDRWEQSKHLTGITYVAVHRISQQLSQAECFVFRKADDHPDGKVPVRRGDPAYKLVELLEKPNKHDSFGKLIYRWSQQMRLTGTALTWMVPNALGVPMELYVIPTAVAIPQPVINPDFPEGFYRVQPLYPYGPFSSYPTPATSVGAPLDARWVLRFQYPHPLLRYDGYSPLTALRLEVDEFESIGRSRWYSMKRSINPSAVLNFDEVEGAQSLPPEEVERIHAEWENNFQGPENHGRLIVGTPGGRLDPWGAAPAEMDYPQGWSQLADFILGGGFGITKSAAGMMDDLTYAALFSSLKQLHLVTLDPDCADISAYLTRHLAPFFGDDLVIEIRCKRIDDHDVKAAKLQIAIGAGAITKNEVRKELELPLTDEAWGDEIAGMMEGGGMEGEGGGGGKPQVPGANGFGAGDVPELGPLVEGGDRKQPAENPALKRNRPEPGKLGMGALGKRPGTKSFPTNGHNGNGNGHRPVQADPPTVYVTVPQPVNNVTVNVPPQKAPVVNVQNHPPAVQVRAPAVNVTVPPAKIPAQKPPVVKVSVPPQKPPVVNVKVPPAPPPSVTVNVPEADPPEVVVNVPPRRLVDKSFEYDELGRPLRVREEEAE